MIDTWLSSLTRALKLRQSIRSGCYLLGSRCHLKIKIPARSNLIGEWDLFTVHVGWRSDVWKGGEIWRQRGSFM